MVRIAFVVTGLAIGGAETMLLQLLNRFDKNRFRMIVIALFYWGRVGDALRESGIPVIYLGAKPASVSLWRLYKTLQEFRPDIIQGHMLHGNCFAQLAGFLFRGKVPVLWNVRHSTLTLRTEKLSTVVLARAMAAISKHAYSIIYNSHAGREVHERLGYASRRATVVPNGFDLDLFRPCSDARTRLRTELGIASDAFLIGLVGRYHPMKDHDTFLRAATLLAGTLPNAYFVLAGHGVDRRNDELTEKLCSLGIDSKTFLLGERRDVPQILAGLDLATSSSSANEGFANVVGEAMSCAVPCVVTDVGDSAHIVGHTGIVVPCRNPPALAEGWMQLINLGIEGRGRLGSAARERINLYFSLDAIVKQYEELYLQVAGAVKPNISDRVVEGFGDEWSRFDQSDLPDDVRLSVFERYFSIFPWNRISESAQGADIGCGSGRWAVLLAPKVGILHCVDASSEALKVAQRNLASEKNVRFHLASVDKLPFADASLDFAVSLGVLHHIPNTQSAIKSVSAKLKPGAPFLVYLYYALDNRPTWFRYLWKATDGTRRMVSRLPLPLRYGLSQVLALFVYWPMSRTATLLDRINCLPKSWPLSFYRDKPFYVMRTDALDRFGTRLEQRFSRSEIGEMLEAAGFIDIRFSEDAPFWCAVGIRS